MYDEAQTMSQSVAVLLGNIAIYVVVIWQAGKVAGSRGYTLLGRRLQSIALHSVACSFAGFIVGGLIVTVLMGGYGTSEALVVDILFKTAGFIWGCVYGWRNPQAD